MCSLHCSNFVFLALLFYVSYQKVEGISESEFLSLKDFYYSLDGEHWKFNANWPRNGSNITRNQICNQSNPNSVILYGVTCYNSVVNPISTISEIFLPYNNLSGTIPATIAHMSNLQQLTLTGNPISGTIPESFYSLIKLNQLHLGHTDISGSISQNISRLRSLEILNFQYNMISGCIPESFYELNQTMTAIVLSTG